MTASKIIKIGTRDSLLALWQARHVAQKLHQLGYETELIPIKSEGDLVLDKPLYEMGITGVFTKTLDIAMLSGKVDIAVHSMKDVPTQLPQGIIQGAVLERANVFDILVYKDNLSFLNQSNAIIATGSLRRKAQWLNKYPKHHIESLRGNVIKRLEKLNQNPWNGAIFASAGLDRIEKKPANHLILDWMTPAPAQGAMMAVALENDTFSLEALQKINHQPTEICTQIERRFLRELEAGCSAPVGGYAHFIDKNTISFIGDLCSVSGEQKISVKETFDIKNISSLPEDWAQYIIHNGGKEILSDIKKSLVNK